SEEERSMIESELDVKKRFFEDHIFLRQEILEAISIRPKKIHNIIVYFQRKYHIYFEQNEKQSLAKRVHIELQYLPVEKEDGKRYKKSHL
ncbi:MAG: hypothetical protein ACP5L4_07370, partial [Thermoplasmata archaeon]